VEVLQVERVIPYLINRRTVECRGTRLELDDEHDRADQQYGIYPPTYTRNAEFHQECSGQPVEMLSKKSNLGQPGIPLCGEDGEFAVPRQAPNNGIGICT
jgi:hypothetical protein